MVEMSEHELASLRIELQKLSEKTDRQHLENRTSQEQDRAAFRAALNAQQQTFTEAMNLQREMFQAALNAQERRVDKSMSLMEAAVGDGQPGSGRVGALETSMELMKKFRWQALAIVMGAMWFLEVVAHRGH